MSFITDTKRGREYEDYNYNPGPSAKKQEVDYSEKESADNRVSELALCQHFDQSEELLWEKLPDELLIHIFSFLPWQDLLRLAGVNTRFQTLLNTDSLWRRYLYKPLPGEGPSKAAVLRKQLLFLHKPISSSSWTVESPNMDFEWLLNDVFFMLNNRSTLVCFNLKTNKKQEFKFSQGPISSAIPLPPNQFILLPEKGPRIFIGKISPEGKVAIVKITIDKIAYNPIAFFEYASHCVFTNIVNGDKPNLVEFQLQGNKVPITYDKCRAINVQTGENNDYYPELKGLKGANNLYLILRPFDDDSWQLVLVLRKTRAQIDLPKEIAEGKFVEMTQRAIYVENENKLMCYDLCSKETHTLNAKLPTKKGQIKIIEFEDKIIVYFNKQLHLYNSEYKATWNRSFSDPIIKITPMAEFLAGEILARETSGNSMNFFDWDHGKFLHMRSFTHVFYFADYYHVRLMRNWNNSCKVDIDKY
jgi:hypothetical protein